MLIYYWLCAWLSWPPLPPLEGGGEETRPEQSDEKWMNSILCSLRRAAENDENTFLVVVADEQREKLKCQPGNSIHHLGLRFGRVAAPAVLTYVELSIRVAESGV